jgi:hypothetical protein
MFRELDLNYKGVQKRVKPTMDMLRFLEQRNVGPHSIVALRVGGQMHAVRYIDFVVSVLQFAGYQVSSDEMYESVHEDPKGLVTLTHTVDIFLSCMLPTGNAPKVATPAKKPRAPRRKTT